MTYDFHPGDFVGSERWPYSSGHPDGWAVPWCGVVLAKDDPVAWSETIIFRGMPAQEQVDEQLESLEPNALQSYTPVLWDFGTYSKVYWERTESLRPYEVDVTEWRKARTVAYASRPSFELRLVS